MATNWTDTPNTFCNCEDEECELLHPDTDILPDRFAFWFKGEKRGTYYAAGQFETIMIEAQDLIAGEAGWQMVDLATGAKADPAEFEPVWHGLVMS